MLQTSSQFGRFPVDMVIVRNAISEGAIAIKKKQLGLSYTMDEKLQNLHPSRWRLTNFGRLQAECTGNWINEHFPLQFDAYITGEFVRSIETAATMKLKGALWKPSLYLRPREFGNYSLLSRGVNPKEVQASRNIKEKVRDSFYWTPPNGESIAQLTLRTERVIHWIRNRVPADGSVVIVTNKDIMEALRIRIEKISQSDYDRRINHCPKDESLHYCSILHYSRRNPKTGEIVPRYSWMRICTPWLGKNYAKEDFKEIYEISYKNEELLAEVSNVPCLF
ncbi:hypothetical protein TVAG_111430 [Trichomonas vaginalis G3]|uniref:phosphoglycerate mutase (2,3-diphosphoglycerate-dependent) n=1 Tax=Trichomonas vaginalis (strain ATCC PRA-98 / G3) TaxID=412133 RepID=A2F002_TRIV3|nr:histidine phosphatase superfamily (branch 1) family [Trichomonas vaginalis G3]EAY01786.1 hypothetical protein TVAG_111430 [Trichomonas vaginalis G3]KAI5546832.1 histidine phosphatase superfamily (branch 1) family [Trichomonas vaginalis G3]|eukprot:XP_001314344.1 hypothetical protein [Trichomonas vaginalis G3]